MFNKINEDHVNHILYCLDEITHIAKKRGCDDVNSMEVLKLLLNAEYQYEIGASFGNLEQELSNVRDAIEDLAPNTLETWTD